MPKRGACRGAVCLHGAPQSDRVVFQSRPGGEIHGIDLTDGARSVVDNPVWQVRFEHKKYPCDMSYSALAPDEHAWVVACETGLWSVNGSDPPTLLLSFETGAASLPPVIVPGMENGARPFWQEFGLALSPDASRIYYCGWKEDTGVLIDVPNRTSRTALSCVTGAIWSPDGRRIIGVTRKGKLGEVVVQ